MAHLQGVKQFQGDKTSTENLALWKRLRYLGIAFLRSYDLNA
jgi:hypothetical protein